MRRLRSLAVGAGMVLACLLAALPNADAASLPSVPSGTRPGPAMLYERPPQAPQLENSPPFRAKPLLVSGTDAYRDGEYLYQDYLFDDRGADTVAGSAGQRDSNATFSPTSGNVAYPTSDRYAGNAADLVELRIKPTADAVVYRVTLNTVAADDAAIVGIGVNTHRAAGPPVAWPSGAGVSSPGLDRFITAWGTGGRVFRRNPSTGQLEPTATLAAGQVTIDRRTHQMTIRVPRSLMDPGTATWRYVAGVGLRSADNGFMQVRQGPPSATAPGSNNPTEGAPGIFNLAFRFDEPQGKVPPPGIGPNLGIGNWFESKQAAVLKRPTPLSSPSTRNFYADVSFARLVAGANAAIHPPRRNQARILASATPVHPGFRDRFPEYGGQLQPYMVRVPPAGPGRRLGLTWSLHSLGGTYTQYAVFDPNLLRELGDQRGNLVVTPLGRGPDGWYMNEAESDFFEVWRDVARHFPLDSERVALTGYSMGGYGTYRLGVLYPDLFGKAFTAVGPPARATWTPPSPPHGDPPAYNRFTQDLNTNPLLANVRWVPYLNWAAMQDELVPYVGVRAQQRTFDRLGLRSELWSFPGEHLTLATRDEWSAARDFLAGSQVTRDPSRIDYTFLPVNQNPQLGLVHDHAYWASGLAARDRSGDPGTNPALAQISARSLAFGEGDPRTARVTSANGGQPAPATVEGTRWTAIPRVPASNALNVRLTNLARATLDGRRARLSGERMLRVQVVADGRGRMRLNLPLPPDAQVRRIGGAPVPGSGPEVALDRGGATFKVAAGSRTYLIGAGALAPASASPGGTASGNAQTATLDQRAGA